MKKIAILLILLMGCVPTYKTGVYDAWTGHEVFKNARGMYGQPIAYNDGIFDCEDFTYLLLKTLGPNPKYTRVAVGIHYKGEEYGHCVAGLLFNNSVYVIEPQTGHYVMAETAYKAVNIMENNVESVELIEWDLFQEIILDK